LSAAKAMIAALLRDKIMKMTRRGIIECMIGISCSNTVKLKFRQP
jgi:hypothetical protein